MNHERSSYPLHPPRERGTGRAFILALVMHALLGLFLYHGIQWQNSTPAGVEAELWSDLTPPPPAAPAPPPTSARPVASVDNEQADIALQEKKRQQAALHDAQLAEQARQKQLAEQMQQQALQRAQLAAQNAAAAQRTQQQAAQVAKLKQLENQKKIQEQKAIQEKTAQAKLLAEQQARQKQLEHERRARLNQLQGLAGESATGNGLAKSGASSGAGGAATSGYAEKVQRRVRPNIIWAGSTQNLETVIAVRCSPTGVLLSSTILSSSGNTQWDDAALRAVQRSDPMPLDVNGRAPANFTITIRPAK